MLVSGLKIVHKSPFLLKIDMIILSFVRKSTIGYYKD